MEFSEETPEQFENLKSNPETLNKDPREEVNSNWQGAVLLSDEISFYSKQKGHPLIHPFEPKNLKPARYKLRLGEDCRVGDEQYWLNEEKPDLVIPPYELAVISTLETLNLPRFLIGRWDLKVKRVYEGLLWVGGPQVDPGYRGKLFCPLYNLSNKTIRLRYGDTIATIDFIRTTPYNANCVDWDGTPNAPRAQYDRFGLMSGLKDAWDLMKKLELSMEKAELRIDRSDARIDNFQATTFIILGIIVAALSFIGVSQVGKYSTQLPHPWDIVSWVVVVGAIAILAIVLAIAGLRTMFRK